MCLRIYSKGFLSIIFEQKVILGCRSIGDFSGSRLNSNARQKGLPHRLYTCLAHHQQCLPPCRHYSISRYYSDQRTEHSFSEQSSPAKCEKQENGICTQEESVKKTVRDFNIDVMVSLLRQENAVDICVIKVPEEVKYTDHFIVVSGSSTRHLRAMALYAIKVHKLLKKNNEPHARIEGKDAVDWMCIDFGSIVVHFMLPEARELYELEKLWTLRSFDEQLSSIPPETLPDDFMYGADVPK
ncbi:mitochondrial assembly of ribosomal large subunit protein 1 [Osmerus mordax]|uniref:mitochondrial assembly of ribosomal large subunit protein 1 n=1 Tax=Osmerus mordax TaxID=8014 RepID=UPI00350FD141